MNENYLEVDGKYYGINMDKVIEFISESSNSTQSITQNYGIPFQAGDKISDDFRLISKEVSETKENVNENMSNLRYSILTYLLNTIMAPLSVQSLRGGKIQASSFRWASISRRREFAATPPPATMVVSPVSSTARSKRLTRILTAVSWKAAEIFSGVFGYS